MISLEHLQFRDATGASASMEWQVEDGRVAFLLCRSRPLLCALFQVLRGFARPLSGRVRIDGKEVRPGGGDESWLFAEGAERGDERGGDWLLIDFLRFYARLGNTPTDAIWPLLVRCGVDPSLLKRRADETDGKMRAMLLLAMSLAGGGKNWVLFDVVRGLGADAELRLGQLLREHSRSKRGATLYLSDDIFLAAQTADRVGIIKDGQLVLDLKAASLRDMDLSRIHLDFLR
jgi:ABC-2 type transport system ATP-binding protein